jgi:hypothetical protein
MAQSGHTDAVTELPARRPAAAAASASQPSMQTNLEPRAPAHVSMQSTHMGPQVWPTEQPGTAAVNGGSPRSFVQQQPHRRPFPARRATASVYVGRSERVSLAQYASGVWCP